MEHKKWDVGFSINETQNCYIFPGQFNIAIIEFNIAICLDHNLEWSHLHPGQ